MLDDLLDQKAANPALGAGEPTVASIIEAYLGVAKYSERALSERRHYLQLFAEHCGWKTIREARRHDLTTFLAANPQWKSDWTLAQVVNIVQRPFNWAVNEERAERNPFKGITHGQGSPRRPMTAEGVPGRRARHPDEILAEAPDLRRPASATSSISSGTRGRGPARRASSSGRTSTWRAR